MIRKTLLAGTVLFSTGLSGSNVLAQKASSDKPKENPPICKGERVKVSGWVYGWHQSGIYVSAGEELADRFFGQKFVTNPELELLNSKAIDFKKNTSFLIPKITFYNSGRGHISLSRVPFFFNFKNQKIAFNNEDKKDMHFTLNEKRIPNSDILISIYIGDKLIASQPLRKSFFSLKEEQMAEILDGQKPLSIMVTDPTGKITGQKDIVLFMSAFSMENFKKAHDLAKEEADKLKILYTNGTCDPDLKVLCTYYYRRGMLADHLMAGDLKYALSVAPQTGRAYRFWAMPLIRYLKQHEGSALDRLAYKFVKGWANEMAHRTGYGGKSNLTGKVLRLIGEPVHYIAGFFIPENEREKAIRQKMELLS